MKAKKVIDVTACGLVFEMYSDGDCVFEITQAGFMQLDRATISQLYKISSKQNKSVSLRVTKDVSKSTVDLPIKCMEYGSVKSRRLVKLDKGVWSCLLFDEKLNSATYYYSNRRQARQAKFSDDIGGENGRIENPNGSAVKSTDMDVGATKQSSLHSNLFESNYITPAPINVIGDRIRHTNEGWTRKLISYSGSEVEYLYKTRAAARTARLEDKIGTHGRIK